MCASTGKIGSVKKTNSAPEHNSDRFFGFPFNEVTVASTPFNLKFVDNGKLYQWKCIWEIYPEEVVYNWMNLSLKKFLHCCALFALAMKKTKQNKTRQNYGSNIVTGTQYTIMCNIEQNIPLLFPIMCYCPPLQAMVQYICIIMQYWRSLRYIY